MMSVRWMALMMLALGLSLGAVACHGGPGVPGAVEGQEFSQWRTEARADLDRLDKEITDLHVAAINAGIPTDRGMNGVMPLEHAYFSLAQDFNKVATKHPSDWRNFRDSFNSRLQRLEERAKSARASIPAGS